MTEQQPATSIPLWRILVDSYRRPFETFKNVQNRPVAFHLIALMSLMVVVGMFIAVASINNTGETEALVNQAGSIELLYSALLLFPLMMMLPAMYFHWVAKSMMGDGKLLDYYKLILWSFIPFTLYIIATGIVVAVVSGLFGASPVFFVAAQFSQLLLLAFYWIVALSVSQKMHWFRSTVVYVLGIGVFVVLNLLINR